MLEEGEVAQESTSGERALESGGKGVNGERALESGGKGVNGERALESGGKGVNTHFNNYACGCSRWNIPFLLKTNTSPTTTYFSATAVGMGLTPPCKLIRPRCSYVAKFNPIRTTFTGKIWYGVQSKCGGVFYLGLLHDMQLT